MLCQVPLWLILRLILLHRPCAECSPAESQENAHRYAQNRDDCQYFAKQQSTRCCTPDTHHRTGASAKAAVGKLKVISRPFFEIFEDQPGITKFVVRIEFGTNKLTLLVVIINISCFIIIIILIIMRTLILFMHASSIYIYAAAGWWAAIYALILF